MKDFNALMNSKTFFYQLVKKNNNNKTRMKNLSKCQESMTIQNEIDWFIFINKTIKNSML